MALTQNLSSNLNTAVSALGGLKNAVVSGFKNSTMNGGLLGPNFNPSNPNNNLNSATALQAKINTGNKVAGGLSLPTQSKISTSISKPQQSTVQTKNGNVNITSTGGGSTAGGTSFSGTSGNTGVGGSSSGLTSGVDLSGKTNAGASGSNSDTTSDPNSFQGQLTALSKKISDYNDTLTGLLKPSDEELTTQKAIDDLQASKQLGLADINGQPIAMRYITGQAANLENRANAQQLPLEQKLARLQAARQNSEAVASKQAENAQTQYTNFLNLGKPTEVSQGASLVRYNPLTGKNETIMQGNPKPEYEIVQDPNTGSYYRINKVDNSVTPVNGAGTGTGQFGISPKATDAQNQAAGYASRAQEAESAIKQFGSVGASLTGLIGSNLPNALKSPERQQLEQAERNFVNAVLRRESGATIQKDEFDNAAKQYFPQPGDSEAVIAQKAQNRATTIQNLIREAQTAYKGNGSTNNVQNVENVDWASI